MGGLTFKFQLCEIWRRLRAQLFLVAVIAAIPLLSINTAAAADPKRVLIVNSFGSTAPPFSFQSTAFKSALVAKMGEPVDLDEVSLDMGRYDADMENAIVDYLERRQAKLRSDLVVPIGAPAASFVAKHRDRLFQETPILYTASDRRLLPPDALERNAAYVGQVLDIPGLFEDMLQVAPTTKNIEIVVGATPLEHLWQEAFKKAAEPLGGRIKFTYYSDLSFDQMLKRVSTLPPDSYVFFLLLLRDVQGVTISADEALQRLHQVSRAPINSIFAHQLGTGIVGGRLLQSDRLGRVAADVAVGILHGEPASNFPSTVIERLSPHYDWRELKRWKIDEKSLPAGSTVLFRQPTIWQQYKGWIIGGVSTLALQAVLIFGLLANLIRRRRAEGSLVESEHRFQNAADAAPVLMWMSGPDKRATFFNKEWLNFTGCTLEQELGDGWADGVHEDDIENTVRRYQVAFEAREPFVIQNRLRRHDGEFRWVTASGAPRYDGKGKFLGYVGASIDITDLLKKEEALHESEERIALAAEAAHLGVWELNLATNELWVSDHWRSLLQLKPGAPVTADDIRERIHPEDRERRDAAIQKAIDENSGYEIEYRVLLPDKTVRWITGRGRCLPNERGLPSRLLGVSADVTDRKQAQMETQLLQDEIAHVGRVSMMGQLASALAHEINQPLGAILRNAEAAELFLQNETPDLEEIRAILADIRSDDQRAGSVIDRMRALLKRHALETDLLDFTELVGDVAELARPDAATRHVKLAVNLPADLPAVRGDRVHLQQVLLNLILNGMDALKEASQENRRVTVSARTNPARTLEISVSDTGHGIAAEKLTHIFDPFFTTKPDGMGMGLAISRTIIEAHGGRLWAENNGDTGATFRFTLPVAEEGSVS